MFNSYPLMRENVRNRSLAVPYLCVSVNIPAMKQSFPNREQLVKATAALT